MALRRGGGVTLRCDAPPDLLVPPISILTGSVIAAVFAGIALAVPTPPAVAPAVSVGPAVRLPGGIEDIEGAGDGSLRAVTSSMSYAANARLTLIEPSWTRHSSATVLPERRAGDTGTAALIPNGVVSVYRSTAFRIRRVQAVDFRTGGSRSRAQTISHPAQSARDPQVFAGGGAVAVLYDEGARSSGRMMLVFRPAGSARFGAPVALDPAAPDLSEYVLVLGADGSGAVVTGPSFVGLGGGTTAHVRVRRIGRDGSLGPWSQVGDGTYGSGMVAAAAGDDGTIAIAMAMDTPSGDTSTLLATSLPPGQDVTTPVQQLADRVDVDLVQENLSVDIGPAGQAVVAAAGLRPGRVDVFTGPAAALTRTGSFAAHDPTGALATVTADGGVTVVWPRSSNDTDGWLLVSHRAPGGTFSRRVMAARTRFRQHGLDYLGPRASPAGVSTVVLVPVGASGAALGYYDRYTHNNGEAGDGFNAYVVRLGS